MAKTINPLERLREHVRRHGTQKAAAAALGIKEPYLSDILNENRRITPKILEKIGLEQVVEIREAR